MVLRETGMAKNQQRMLPQNRIPILNHFNYEWRDCEEKRIRQLLRTVSYAVQYGFVKCL